jgi:hypothetical protein
MLHGKHITFLTKSCGIISVTNCQKAVFTKLPVSGTIRTGYMSLLCCVRLRKKTEMRPLLALLLVSFSSIDRTFKAPINQLFFDSIYLETNLTFGPKIISSLASYKLSLAIQLFQGTFLQILMYETQLSI